MKATIALLAIVFMAGCQTKKIEYSVPEYVTLQYASDHLDALIEGHEKAGIDFGLGECKKWDYCRGCAYTYKSLGLEYKPAQENK